MKEQKKKERLDVLLVKRVLAESREKAKAIIMTGNVFVNDQREDKAGSTFPTDCKIEIKGTPMKYVSRGGYKLEKAIDLWQVPLQDKICMDVGSSTGGFTDCMLQNGASKVYAIDVGTNQLAWKLRQDDRVVSMEKTNIRYVTHEIVTQDVDFSSHSFCAIVSISSVGWLPCSVSTMPSCSRIHCTFFASFCKYSRYSIFPSGQYKYNKAWIMVL